MNTPTGVTDDGENTPTGVTDDPNRGEQRRGSASAEYSVSPIKIGSRLKEGGM